MIRVMEKTDMVEVVRLWNQCVDEKDFVYKKINMDVFYEMFLKNPNYSEEYCLVSEDDGGRIEGFICGLIKRDYLNQENFNNTPGYITMVIVDSSKRDQGVGTSLITELEQRFIAIGKNEVMITYRNPINLPWIIPGTEGFDHNNAPGIDIETQAYALFQKLGYETSSIELGMYMDLKSFSYPQKYYDKIKEQNEQNKIEVELYDKEKHWGFDELFDNLHGEVWRRTIADNQKREEPLPVIVASHNNKIVGFAGPIAKQESGRGWFNGIATHSEYGRKGIAYVMFLRLMGEFQTIGAKFSTLFTDDQNPAYILYCDTGFQIGKKWAVMRKPLA